MGVQSVERMSRIAAELRASMPPPTDHAQMQAADSQADPSRIPLRSSLSTLSARRPVANGTAVRRGGRPGEPEMQLLEKEYDELRVRFEEVLKQNETLKTDTRRRMESYIRREARYKTEVDELRDELRRATSSLGVSGEGGGSAGVAEGEGGAMRELHAMHGQILSNIGGLQGRTKAVLQEQESDLLRAFRARLYDLQMELEAERSKKDDGALEWIERTRTLGKELDWSREEALRLDRTNASLSKEIARLRSQASAQDDDRQFLLRQLVGLRKDNAALREAGAAAAAAEQAAPKGASGGGGGRAVTVDVLTFGSRPNTSGSAGSRAPLGGGYGRGSPTGNASAPQLGRPTTPAAAAPAGGKAADERARELQVRLSESERRANDVIAKLKKALEGERRALRALRTAHVRELQSRTELEIFLRQCLHDVKAQLAQARTRADLSAPERARVMELLLSQDRVVTLLYEKTFPARRAADQQPGAQSAWQGELLTQPEADEGDDELAATGEGFGGSEEGSTLGPLGARPTFDHFPSPEGGRVVSSPAAYLAGRD